MEAVNLLFGIGVVVLACLIAADLVELRRMRRDRRELLQLWREMRKPRP